MHFKTISKASTVNVLSSYFNITHSTHFWSMTGIISVTMVIFVDSAALRKREKEIVSTSIKNEFN